MRVTLVVPALMLALAQQTPPPPPPPPQLPVSGQPARDTMRRAPPDPVGTASIRGRVVTSDAGAPVRRSTVNLSMAMSIAMSQAVSGTASIAQTQSLMMNTPVMMARPRSTTTDTQGMFEFKNLPAGTYRLSVSPGQYSGQYLGIAYGAKRPNGPGSNEPGEPIQLADGQAFTASIALPRGTVITGHVSDENGDPLARVQVYTLFFPPGSLRGQRAGQNVQTDDLGSFRVYGLPPGEYAVVAEARSNTFVPPNAPPETEEERIGWLTTYYPNSADEAGAQHVRTRAGTETSGIEIRLTTGRMVHISGTVVDSQGRADTRFNGQLMPRTSSGIVTNVVGIPIDPSGHFQVRNIAPGEYRLIVRENVVRPPNADPRTPPDPGEFAMMPLSLSTDADDLIVTTRPGATVTGQVVYEGAPPMAENGQPQMMPRVFAQPTEQNPGMMPLPQSVVVSSDLTFTMKGFMGEVLLRATGQNQFLKAVQVGGEDITDTPREFKQGDSVTIVMTTRAATVEGSVTDDQSQPVNAGSLLIFSEDKTLWRMSSIRSRRGSIDITGHFRMAGLLGGRYYLIALPPERASALNFGNVDPALFEQLTKEATLVTVGDDEDRQVDLKLASGSGGS